MSRVRRLTYAGAYYHVINRGINGIEIFHTPKDFNYYLKRVKKYSKEYGVDILAFALMPNHIHLLIHTPKDTLSRMMKSLNTSYVVYFNKKYDRNGPLFQGRFKSIIVDKDAYLLEVTRYIHLQALRAGIIQNLGDYPWTSYREYVKKSNQYPWLKKESILSQFKSKNAFLTFTLEGLKEKSLPITAGEIGYFYSKPEFVERVEAHLNERKTQKKRKGRRKGDWRRCPEFPEGEIIDVTLSYYGLNKITGIESHLKDKVRIRKVLTYLLKKYAGLYNYEIANTIKRDKSVVSRYLNELDKTSFANSIWEDIDKILKTLHSSAPEKHNAQQCKDRPFLEIEVKILEIDKEGVIGRLKELGAKKVFDGEILSVYFDFDDGRLGKEKKVLRLRKKESKVNLTFKKGVSEEKARVMEEYEFGVESFALMKKALNGLGLSVTHKLDKYRSSYVLNNIRFEIDSYPGIPTFLEIEAPSLDELKASIHKIGFSINDAKPYSIREVLEYYGKL